MSQMGRWPRARGAQWVGALLLTLTVLSLAPGRARAQQDAPAAGAARSQPARARLSLDPEAVRLKAQVLVVDGEYRRAGRLLQQYLKQHPDDWAAWLIQAKVFESLKRYALALKALGHVGERPGVHLARGRILFKQGEAAAATAELEEAVRRYPDLGDAHHFLGYLYLTQKRPQEALASLNRALQTGTTREVATHFYLGQAYYDLGELGKARDHLNIAQRQGRGTDYAKPAEDFLDLLSVGKESMAPTPEEPREQAEEGPEKTWTAFVQLAAEFDSNVTLTPDGETPESKARRAVRNVFSAGADARLYKRGDFRLRGTLATTFAFHYGNDGEASQLLAGQGGLYSPYSFSIGKDPAVLMPLILGRVALFGRASGVKETGDLDFTEQAPFSIDVEPGLRFSWQHAPRRVFSAAMSYINSRFTDQVATLTGGDPQSDRNSHNIRLSLTESFLLDARAEKDMSVDLFVAGGYRLARTDDFTFWAAEGGARATWRALDRLKANASVKVRFEDHFDSNGPEGSILPGEPKRRDTTLSAELGAQYRLTKGTPYALWAVLRYLWDHNFSTLNGNPSDLEYDKHVISLAIRVDL